MATVKGGTVSLAPLDALGNVTRLVVGISSDVVPQSASNKELATKVRRAGVASFVAWNTNRH